MGITPELLSDLVDYTSHRDKAVHNAARSLLKTLREVHLNLVLRVRSLGICLKLRCLAPKERPPQKTLL